LLQVDIFHLPSEKRIHTIPSNASFKGGMVMAISIFDHPISNLLTVLTGYESGHTSVSHFSNSTWQTLYLAQAHTQPILSLDVAPDKTFYLTSSADAIIAKHSVPSPGIGGVEEKPLKELQTKHAGQQGLKIRNDGKLFSTAGWDSRVRVYSCKGMRELAVLKWHKDGCYAVAFANVSVTEAKENSKLEEKELVKRETTMTIKQERLHKAATAHWLAAGSKDGKVSLWDIY
jgi:WD40 repeat protein